MTSKHMVRAVCFLAIVLLMVVCNCKPVNSQRGPDRFKEQKEIQWEIQKQKNEATNRALDEIKLKRLESRLRLEEYSSDHRIYIICDTKTGNLIYKTLGSYQYGPAIDVVANGCAKAIRYLP